MVRYVHAYVVILNSTASFSWKLLGIQLHLSPPHLKKGEKRSLSQMLFLLSYFLGCAI